MESNSKIKDIKPKREKDLSKKEKRKMRKKKIMMKMS